MSKKRSPSRVSKSAHSVGVGFPRRTPPTDRHDSPLPTRELIARLAASWNAHLAALPVLEDIPPADLTWMMAQCRALRRDLARTDRELMRLVAWTRAQPWAHREGEKGVA
jgi:hypothetical protein